MTKDPAPQDTEREIGVNYPCGAILRRIEMGTYTIPGLELYAVDCNGDEIEIFKVVWLGKLAYGIINDDTTEKTYVELRVKEN